VRFKALLPLAAGAALLLANKSKGSGMSAPRGIRNNNPGNLIITGIEWNGKVPVEQNTDGVYEQFHAPVWGIRAMYIDITGDIERKGQNTLRTLISAYAPEHENDTEAYIKHLSQRLGLAPEQPIKPGHYRPLLESIILHENGVQPYSASLIDEAIEKAGR